MYYMQFYHRYNLDDYVHDHEYLDIKILKECQECIERERNKAIWLRGRTTKLHDCAKERPIIVENESHTKPLNIQQVRIIDMIDKEALKQRYGCNYQEQYIDIHLALEAQECTERAIRRDRELAEITNKAVRAQMKKAKLRDIKSKILSLMAERNDIDCLLRANLEEHKALRSK